MKRDYDVKVRVRELKLGDLVYQLDTATVKGKTRKLSPSWKGPGVVIEKSFLGLFESFPSYSVGPFNSCLQLPYVLVPFGLSGVPRTPEH
jgi:hypothetical protein